MLNVTSGAISEISAHHRCRASPEATKLSSEAVHRQESSFLYLIEV